MPSVTPRPSRCISCWTFPALKFRYLTGVGDKVRREIRERAKRLAQLRPDLVPGGSTEDDGRRASVDRLAEQLIARRPAGDEKPEDASLPATSASNRAMLRSGRMPARSRSRSKSARSRVAEVLQAGRERWHKNADLNAVRSDIDGLIQAKGGVASLDELTMQLLAARGRDAGG